MKVYLDNSATSWPKPKQVIQSMNEYLNDFGGSPGRSGHQFAIKAAREIFETRELISALFHVDSSEKIIFTANATHALNIAIKGVLKKGDHVIISHMEHNAVVRPLRFLESIGIIELTVVPCNKKGYIDLEILKKSFQKNTKLVVSIHGSNVSGTIQPIKEIGEICKTNRVLYLVDAAQTAGIIPIDMQESHIDLLAFTGHKKLYGPPGIGGLCIQNNLMIDTLIHGGTGSKSEMETHPEFYPDRLEAGTANTVGIIGLKAGVNYILQKGIDHLYNKQKELITYFISLLEKMDDIIIYGPNKNEERLPLVSVNIRNMTCSDFAYKLDKEFNIMVRPGLHCSPLAHKSIGSFPEGTVRFSLGCFNAEEEIMYTIDAIKKIIVDQKKSI